MKVLLCHNHYRQPGGEDQVFADEGWLLESRGHEVVRYVRHNQDIDETSRWRLAQDTLWNKRTYQEVRELIEREQPAVLHCHNIFPLISPAVYQAARDTGVAVVQSLHNYRIFCPGFNLFRNGKVCESCIGKTLPWNAIVHGCYRDSHSATTVVAAMQVLHVVRRTWHQSVDRYIALSTLSKQKFVQAGLPAEKITIKPNFVQPDPGPGTGAGGYAVFVGRLVVEKGIESVLKCWSELDTPLRLKIVGDGPLAHKVAQAAAHDDRIEWIRWCSLEEVCATVSDALFLIMPSIWHEPFGRTTIEAFATGTPVLAARMGAMTDMVTDGVTGLHFDPGDAVDMRRKIGTLLSAPGQVQRMRKSARETYEDLYTAEHNYELLLDVYEQAIGNRYPQPAKVSQP